MGIKERPFVLITYLINSEVDNTNTNTNTNTKKCPESLQKNDRRLKSAHTPEGKQF